MIHFIKQVLLGERNITREFIEGLPDVNNSLVL
jgi:hypothetical protein